MTQTRGRKRRPAKQRVLWAGLLGLGAALLGLYAEAAHAISLKEIIGNLQDAMGTILDFVFIVCALIGAFLVIKAIMDFWAYNKPQSQVNSLAQPVVALIIGGLLLAVSAIMLVPTDVLFGTSNPMAPDGKNILGVPVSTGSP